MHSARTFVFLGSVLVSAVLLAVFASGYFDKKTVALPMRAAPSHMLAQDAGTSAGGKNDGADNDEQDDGDEDQGTEVQQPEQDEQNRENGPGNF